MGEYLAAELILGSSGLTRCLKSESGDEALGENETCSYVGNKREYSRDGSSTYST